ncbi:MAG: hypothetical protein MUC38_04210 [Cyclobacteriaceae bacterium]|jgi:hypothetical protein|nr:hypothetical protein [Cyclobacteriaceae bacterium]
MEEKMTIRIFPSEKREYGIKGTAISFEKLKRKILQRSAQQALENAANAAREAGLAKTSRQEIIAIIKQVQKRA